MSIQKVFKMPKTITLQARTSSITNAFVSGIIPAIQPTDQEVKEALDKLGLTEETIQCVYCGDKCTEWDHLRPIVKDKKPTGYITDIYNLVPCCGKCNQSKGNKQWEKWMRSNATYSPNTRKIQDLEERVARIKKYEQWQEVEPIDLSGLCDRDDWNKHWENLNSLNQLMLDYNVHAQKIRNQIANNYKK